MKRIKDFVYDKNDILIALLILVAAALIIIWRMGAIMDYPQQLLKTTGTTFTQEEIADAEFAEITDSSAEQSGEPESDGLWVDGALTEDIDVTVQGTTASAAVECLVEAGLFEDYAEYQAICEETGLDHEKVNAGVFTFEAGSTKEDIARQINWS